MGSFKGDMAAHCRKQILQGFYAIWHSGTPCGCALQVILCGWAPQGYAAALHKYSARRCTEGKENIYSLKSKSPAVRMGEHILADSTAMSGIPGSTVAWQLP